MSKFRSARAVLAGATVAALAGCGASASSSTADPGTSSASASASSSTSASAGSAAAATPSASSNAFVPTGSISFPVAVGNTWIYQTTAAVDGRRVLQTDRILSVTPAAGNSRVVMSETADADAARTSSQETLVFYANGSIGYPVTGSEVSVLGNGVLWPSAAGLASGQAYHSVLPVKVNKTGPATDANVTVQGSGTHSVTVPAGTYQATLITTTMTVKVSGFGTTEEVQTWVAPGTGPVKSEVSLLTNGQNKVVSTQELVSFTQG
jgi:hypothetical protein